MIYSAIKRLGQNSIYPLKFQRFFNLNPKVSKLTVYSPEISKSDNLNIPLKFSIKMGENLKKK
jgi:hypothetical protein